MARALVRAKTMKMIGRRFASLFLVQVLVAGICFYIYDSRIVNSIQDTGGVDRYARVAYKNYNKEEKLLLLESNKQQPNLFLHVIDFREGMVAWKKTTRDFIGIAKSLNATFVEPCVSHGRLRSCGYRTNSTLIPLSEIFDMEVIRLDFWPHIVSYQDFVQRTNYNLDTNYTQHFNQTLFAACFNKYRSKKRNGAPKACLYYPPGDMKKIKIESTFFQTDQPTFDNAFLAASKNPEAPVILDVWDAWREGRYDLWKPSVHGMNPRERFDLEEMLRFPPSASKQVQSMISQFNITNNNYAVIQWRPETKPIDYMACADAIIDMRKIISNETGIPVENFILISPLSLNKDLQWGGVREWADKYPNSSYPSLQMLYDAGFHKLEQTFNESDIDDSLMAAMWDFTLASEAKYFTTCSRLYRKKTSQFCDKCNWLGKSQNYVIELRGKIQGWNGTHPDWPL